MKPMISIITVCFNAQETILRAISSVLRQSYKNIEYIIIDGGSTDNTLNIIENYRSSLSYFISERDEGISEAFNKGIKQTKGEIIGILNSDDWYERDAVQTIVDLDVRYAADVYIGSIYLHRHKQNLVVKPDKNYESLLKYRMPRLNHPAAFIKREVYLSVGYYNEGLRYAMDYDFFLRCFLGKKVFCLTNKVLTNMSMGGVSDKYTIGAYREVFKIAPEKKRALLWYFYSSSKFYIIKILRFFGLQGMINLATRLKYR